MIVKVNGSNITAAAEIHSESWIQSHKSFCSRNFVLQHTVANQEKHLRDEMRAGKEIFVLVGNRPVGIVSVCKNLIENLYILPDEQHNGYGTKLLLFAMGQCPETPTLWLLSNNRTAYSLYYQHGFRKTGDRNKLSECIFEYEMACTK